MCVYVCVYMRENNCSRPWALHALGERESEIERESAHLYERDRVRESVYMKVRVIVAAVAHGMI